MDSTFRFVLRRFPSPPHLTDTTPPIPHPPDSPPPHTHTHARRLFDAPPAQTGRTAPHRADGPCREVATGWVDGGEGYSQHATCYVIPTRGSIPRCQQTRTAGNAPTRQTYCRAFPKIIIIQPDVSARSNLKLRGK